MAEIINLFTKERLNPEGSEFDADQFTIRAAVIAEQIRRYMREIKADPMEAYIAFGMMKIMIYTELMEMVAKKSEKKTLRDFFGHFDGAEKYAKKVLN